MDLLKMIILTLGILCFIEGLLITISPKFVQKMIKKFSTDVKRIRKAGLVELIISIILILIYLIL